MLTTYSALVGASRRYYRKYPEMYKKITKLLSEIHREFGLRSRIYSSIGGWWLHRQVLREEKRLAEGWTYEPPTFYEKNYKPAGSNGADQCRFVVPTLALAEVFVSDGGREEGQPSIKTVASSK